MKTDLQRFAWMLLSCGLIITTRSASAAACGYPNDARIEGIGPKGFDKLVNTTNRVYGYCYNALDAFFFSGGASELTTFLEGYSQLEGIEIKCLILHDGTGEAKLLREKGAGVPCDWKIDVLPKGMHNLAVLSKQNKTNSIEVLRKAVREPGFISEVHFWTGGHIALDQVKVPKNVTVLK